MIYLYKIFILLLQVSSSQQAGPQGQGRPGGHTISNVYWCFLWILVVPSVLRRVWTPQERKQVYTRVVQSRHAEAPERVVLWGDLGQGETLADPQSLVEQRPAGRQHWSCYQQGPSLCCWEKGESKSCSQLDLTVYLKILMENSGNWNRKDINAPQKLSFLVMVTRD